MPLIGTLTSGVSAMRAFTKNLEVIGNNIANVNTVGFKAQKVNFADTFSNSMRTSAPNSGGNTSNTQAMQIGTGVSVSQVQTNFGQGSPSATGVTTDLAISGEGFFMVKSPSGQYFATRAGNFHYDDRGYLVNDQGYRLQGMMNSTTWSGSTPTNTAAYGDIKRGTASGTSEVASTSIGRDGQVVETYSNGDQNTVANILLYKFNDPGALTKEGNNLYSGFAAAGFSTGITNPTAATAADNAPNSNGLGFIQSGALELGNVDLTEQFSDMITVQRSFQASSRLVSVSDQILEDIVNLKR